MGSTLRAPSSLARSVAAATPADGAGDDHLSGGVVVGHPDLVLGPLAGGLGVVVGDPDERGHGAGALVRRHLHGVAPFDDQPGPVGEREGPRGHQSGVLAEAVAGARPRGQPEALDGVEDHQAHHEGGQLGVGRPGQLLHRCIEQQEVRSRPAMSEASAATSHDGCSTQA